MTRCLSRSVLLAVLLVACEAPLEPNADPRPPETLRIANVTCQGCGLERITLEVTDLELLVNDVDQPKVPLFGAFSCESGQRFASISGAVITDDGATRTNGFQGRLIMPAFEQHGDMGPFSVAGDVTRPDGTTRTGFFMTRWDPGARSCAVTDGVMRIVINTRFWAAVSGALANGDNEGGTVLGHLRGHVEISSDMVVISSGFTIRLLAPSDPGEITITPADITRVIGTAHEMTFSVRDLGSDLYGATRPVEGASVLFSVTGSASIISECTTNALGQCTVSYGGPRFPVTDHITAFVDINGDGVKGFGEPSATSTVSWGDDEPPVITAPPDFTVSTNPGKCSAVISTDAFGNATAIDNSGTASIVGPSGGTFSVGVTSVIWTATDPAGNQATATQSVTVIDDEGPTLAAPASVSVGNDPGRDYAMVATGAATSSDNCASNIPIGTRNDGRGLTETYPVGTTVITWTVEDASGNPAPGVLQTVTVNDVEDPVITGPAGLVVNATSPNGVAVSYGESATDNVAVASLLCIPPSGSVLAIGTTPVRCTARDAARNEATASFPVTVLGAPEQIVNLLEYIRRDMPSAQETQIIDSFQRALSDPRRATHVCSMLDLLIESARSKTGRMIAPDKAARVIEDATRIKAVLSCA